MKISELIERLGELQGKEGDIEVVVMANKGNIQPIMPPVILNTSGTTVKKVLIDWYPF